MTPPEPSVAATPLAVGETADAGMEVNSSDHHGRRVVSITGELDIATGHLVEEACADAGGLAVELDLAHLSFMDSSGYAAIVAARRTVEDNGGSLTMLHRSGQPAHLLELIAVLDASRPSGGR